ncbi:MAG: hypothetical protein QXR53_04440 [Candidatus Norongarragalinales archaeon]
MGMLQAYHKAGKDTARLLHGTVWTGRASPNSALRENLHPVYDLHETVGVIHANPPFLKSALRNYFGMKEPLRVSDEMFQKYQDWKKGLFKLKEELGFDVHFTPKTNLVLADEKGNIRMKDKDLRQTRNVEIGRGTLSAEQWEAFVNGLVEEIMILKHKEMIEKGN